MLDLGQLTEIALPAFATLFVAIDPIGLVPIFMALTAHADLHARRRIAWRAIVTATVLLLAFALFGKALLGHLGISLPAFQIAGGLLLFMLAVEMLFEKRNERRGRSASEAEQEDPTGDDVAIFPLGVPLICGPGAIASVILLVGEHEGDYTGQAIVIGVMLAVLVLTGALFFLANRFGRLAGQTFTKAMTRVLGMILAALAVQFVITGLANAGFVAAG